jgi:23S rRNA (cytidine1920-2'-O)/16S rRNA (cytidine1409-2'-O)-methyltransferase
MADHLPKIRLDQLLLQKGLAESRHKAKAIIMAGQVEVEGTRVDKPGRLFSNRAEVSLLKTHPPYVSRGGLKLEAALRHFAVQVAGKVMLDIGASTGGFTDCLLQYGARRVIAVDVGHGQLDWKLRRDPRVRVLERTNARYLTHRVVPESVYGATIDVSFISLRLVVPAVSALLQKRGFIIALIKPQFEAGRSQVGKGGVVRDTKVQQRIVSDLSAFFEQQEWKVEGHIPSPLLGPKGNREFFICLRSKTH